MPMPPIVDTIVPQYLRADSGQLPKIRLSYWYQRSQCWFVPDSIAEDGAVMFRLVRDYNAGKWRPRGPARNAVEMPDALTAD